jgi:DNA invertase Pin-like site-specific DNA recombinase
MRITSSKVAALAKQFRVDPELITAIADTLAEQEHSRMSRRTRAGVARARKLGRVSGPVQMPLDMAEVKARQAKGQSLRTIAKAMGCSASLLVKRAKGGRQGRP